MDSANGDHFTLVVRTVARVIDKVYSMTNKKSILMTHSQGGLPGCESARYINNIVSIITIEPGFWTNFK